MKAHTRTQRHTAHAHAHAQVKLVNQQTTHTHHIKPRYTANDVTRTIYTHTTPLTPPKPTPTHAQRVALMNTINALLDPAHTPIHTSCAPAVPRAQRTTPHTLPELTRTTTTTYTASVPVILYDAATHTPHYIRRVTRTHTITHTDTPAGRTTTTRTTLTHNAHTLTVRTLPKSPSPTHTYAQLRSIGVEIYECA